MHEVSVTMSFSAAHNLRGYQGKCEELHGHNWKVEVVLRSRVLNDIGMVEDFTLIKERLKDVLSLFDHKYLNVLPYFKKMNPTSENIAKIIYTKMKERLKSASLKMGHIVIWETETSCARYSEP